MRPYFSVGEEVILCSKEHPEYNGEYVVEKFVSPGDRRICRVSGELRVSNVYGYVLNVPFAHGDRLDALADPSSLRKKHKPADQSFSELIKSTRELKA